MDIFNNRMSHDSMHCVCNTTVTMRMNMWFTEYYKNLPILFEPWVISDDGIFALTFIAIIAMGIVHEGLKFGRKQLDQKRMLASRVNCCEKDCCKSNNQKEQTKFSAIYYILLLFFYACQVTIGYFVMLITMTYNTYLLIAIVAGLSMGYGLFLIPESKYNIAPTLVEYSEDTCCH